jgi:hypothetical protein
LLFFVISHDRRRILHCNATRHPTGFWISQQLREAFPYDHHGYLIHDRDAKFGDTVSTAVSAIGPELFEHRFEALVKMESPNVGLAVADGICSTM